MIVEAEPYVQGCQGLNQPFPFRQVYQDFKLYHDFSRTGTLVGICITYDIHDFPFLNELLDGAGRGFEPHSEYQLEKLGLGCRLF